MRYLHERFHAYEGARIEVMLSRPGANVMLMTDAQLTRYERGENFEFYGGNYSNQTVAELVAPRTGMWNLVIDLGGAPGTVSATYSVFPP